MKNKTIKSHSQSELEEEVLRQLKKARVPKAKQQLRICPERRWYFDFAWPKHMLAVEIEGGVYNRGRHVRGKGYTDDCTKYNAALLLGWRVLRFTCMHVKDGVIPKIVKEALKCRKK